MRFQTDLLPRAWQEIKEVILRKNGKNEFVVLPYEEFTALSELLSDYQDLLDLRTAKKEENTSPSVPLAD